MKDRLRIHKRSVMGYGNFLPTSLPTSFQLPNSKNISRHTEYFPDTELLREIPLTPVSKNTLLLISSVPYVIGYSHAIGLEDAKKF